MRNLKLLSLVLIGYSTMFLNTANAMEPKPLRLFSYVQFKEIVVDTKNMNARAGAEYIPPREGLMKMYVAETKRGSKPLQAIVKVYKTKEMKQFVESLRLSTISK